MLTSEYLKERIRIRIRKKKKEPSDGRTSGTSARCGRARRTTTAELLIPTLV